MTLNAKEATGGGGGDFTRRVLEAGAYPARVVVIAGLGLQKQRPYKGEEKDPKEELLVTYELLDEFIQDEDGNDIEDKPILVSERFPFYNLEAERAKSTKRYIALDPEIEFDGDWTKLIEQPCTVTLSKDKGKNDKFYNNVSNVSTMRAKDAAKAPDLVNPSVVFDPSEADVESFRALSEWVQKIVREGLEFEGSPLARALESSSDYTEHDPEPEEEEDW